MMWTKKDFKQWLEEQKRLKRIHFLTANVVQNAVGDLYSRNQSLENQVAALLTLVGRGESK